MDMRQILTEHAFDRARTAVRESLDLATRGASADDPPREYDYLHKDGTIVPCEVVSRLIFDETSAPVAVVSVSRDARERKRADAERRRLEARMQQAQKLESMGILAGGIAHDFNNILVGILGNADLALENCGRLAAARLPPPDQPLGKTGRRPGPADARLFRQGEIRHRGD